MGELILASQSPRRQEMLRRLGLVFTVAPADVDERPREAEEAAAYAQRTAVDKATAVARRLAQAAPSPPAAEPWILGADTVVVLEGAILEKPADEAEARAMLEALAGRWHEVSTGYCILGPGGADRQRVVTTRVAMRQPRPWELDAYLASGEWADKAGAYGIQARAAALVAAVEGSYTNVVGLPLSEVVEDLIDLGVAREGMLYG